MGGGVGMVGARHALLVRPPRSRGAPEDLSAARGEGARGRDRGRAGAPSLDDPPRGRAQLVARRGGAAGGGLLAFDGAGPRHAPPPRGREARAARRAGDGRDRPAARRPVVRAGRGAAGRRARDAAAAVPRDDLPVRPRTRWTERGAGPAPSAAEAQRSAPPCREAQEPGVPRSGEGPTPTRCGRGPRRVRPLGSGSDDGPPRAWGRERRHGHGAHDAPRRAVSAATTGARSPSWAS